MTYRDFIDLRDITVMRELANDIPEEDRIAFMDRYKVACKTADEEFQTEQLPIILGSQEKAGTVWAHLDDEMTGQ